MPSIRANFKTTMNLYKQNAVFFTLPFSNPTLYLKTVFTTPGFKAIEREFNKLFNQQVEVEYKMMPPRERVFPAVKHRLYLKLKKEYEIALLELSCKGNDAELKNFFAKYPDLSECIAKHATALEKIAKDWEETYANYSKSSEFNTFKNQHNALLEKNKKANKSYFSMMINNMKQNLYYLRDTQKLSLDTMNFFAALFQTLKPLLTTLNFTLSPNDFADSIHMHNMLNNAKALIQLSVQIDNLLDGVTAELKKEFFYQLQSLFDKNELINASTIAKLQEKLGIPSSNSKAEMSFFAHHDTNTNVNSPTSHINQNQNTHK